MDYGKNQYVKKKLEENEKIFETDKSNSHVIQIFSENDFTIIEDKNKVSESFSNREFSDANNEIKENLNKQLPTTELREYEQYFFTENVIQNICEALEYEDNIICLGTPAVADGFLRLKNKIILCLDIDKRFNYLPGYRFFDILKFSDYNYIEKPNVLVIDPPFFKMNLVDLFNCVEFLTQGDKKTKIIFAFVHREEKSLLNIFKSYNLKQTKFKLEYRYVEPSKWDNYSLYSNYEFNKIKFLNKPEKLKNNQKSIAKLKFKK